MMKLRHVPLLCAAFIAAPAIAQDAPAASPPPSPEEITNRDTLTIAAGGAMFPDYEGSNDYRFIPALGIRGQYHGFSFTTRGLYLYVDVIPDGAIVSVFPFRSRNDCSVPSAASVYTRPYGSVNRYPVG